MRANNQQLELQISIRESIWQGLQSFWHGGNDVKQAFESPDVVVRPFSSWALALLWWRHLPCLLQRGSQGIHFTSYSAMVSTCC